MPRIEDSVGALSTPPAAGTTAYQQWMTHRDFLDFLLGNVSDKELVLYAGGHHVFVYGILVPSGLLNDESVDSLLEWNGTGCTPYSSWGIMGSAPDFEAELASPLNTIRPDILVDGEQLLFARSFDGRSTFPRYVEIAQRLSHVMGLHFVEERSAFCRFDGRGDIEDVVRIILPSRRNPDGITLVTIQRSVLDQYMLLSKTSYLRLFESCRFDRGKFGGWDSHEADQIRQPDQRLFYRHGTNQDGSASYARGIQFIHSRATREDLAKIVWGVNREQKRYVAFLVDDWKHERVQECSCDPDHLGNYFVKSDLPHGLSPAFFRPEVLQKYKADPKKYALQDRSVSCRDTWHLEAFDVNEVGQVHAYLIYLGRLPYEEQLYWKSFNEEPKGPISKRAQQTDFKGEWDLEYDPLISLRELARELSEAKVPWWVLRSADLIDGVHYPVTESSAEWGRELHALDKLVNEGLDTKELRRIAERVGRKIETTWRTLKLIEETLWGLGKSPDEATEIVGPLRELSKLRVQMSAHATGESAEAERTRVLREHGRYPVHFRQLCAQCDKAMRELRDLLR